MKKRNLIFSLLALVSVLGSCGKGNVDTSLPTVNPSTQQPTDKKSTPSSEEPKKIFYTITFNLNGGEIADPTAVASQRIEEGHWAKKPTINPTKKNCKFVAWVDEDGNEFNFRTGIYGDVDLYAKWSVNEDLKITLTFDPNNGEPTFEQETFVGDYLNVPVPHKDGFVFIGWYLNGDKTQKWTGYVDETMDKDTLVALYEKQSFNYKYEVNNDGSATITGIMDINVVDVQIPESINGRPVTGISATAFKGGSSITQISISASVKTIDPKAFMYTNKLASITVDGSNTAYKSKEGLLFSKDEQTLVFCPQKALTSNQSYDCPSNLKKIGDYAFYNQRDVGLKYITFNEGLEEIGDYAFYGDISISSVSFPSSLKKIGNAAFEMLGDSTTNQFTITWSEGLEEIGESAFTGAYIKGDLKLPDSIKILRSYAFSTPMNSYCAIESVKLPASLEVFEPGVFFYGMGIKSVALASSNTNFKVENNILLTKDGKKLVYIPSDATTTTTSFAIPSTVEELLPKSCSDVRYVDNFTLPSSLKKIDNNAFHNNINVTSITIPDSVTEIGKESFMFMDKLSSLHIGTGITEIPEAAFYSCPQLTNIEIPSNVKKIGVEAFAQELGLRTLTLNEGLEVIEASAFSNNGSSESEDDPVSSYKSKVTKLVLPNSLTTIGDSAFSGWSSLQEVVFGAGLTSMNGSVFSGNGNNGVPNFKLTLAEGSNLKLTNDQLISADGKTVFYCKPSHTGAINVPEGVETISKLVYYRVKASSLTLPSTLKIIENQAFASAFDSSNKVKVTIPSNVSKIGASAFYFANIYGLTFNEGVQEIGDEAFESTNDLGNITLPASLKRIGTKAFFSCGVTGVTLNEGLEEIDDYAFLGNPKMAGEITIPSTLKTMGVGAFVGRVNNYSTELTAFNVASGNNYFSAVDGVLFDKNQTTLYCYPSKKADTAYVMPSTVVTIKENAMAGLQNLSSLTLNDGLENIGAEAFSNSLAIRNVNIPSSVVTIGYRAFSGWTKAQTISVSHTEDEAAMLFGSDWINSCNAVISYGE